MTDMIKEQVKGLSLEGIMLLVQDAERRIGSHVAGGYPVDAYVKRQQEIMSICQDELVRRQKLIAG